MKCFKIFFIFLILFLIFTSRTTAQTVDELRDKINNRNEAIVKLEQEIRQYQKDIEALGKEKDSLANTIKSLDISKKKLETDIKITENKIATKNLEIKELSLKIGDKNERIDGGKVVISQSLYKISQMNSASVIEAILGKESFSDLWNQSDDLTVLQSGMQNKIKELENLKFDLEDNKRQTEKKKVELVTLTNDLRNQKKIIAETVKEKKSILIETKNTEANYNKLLAQRKAQKEAFEREVLEFESAMRIVIDPRNLPISGKGILRYPLNNPRITQYFGNTEFATANSQIYNDRGHGGIDLATSIGTPIYASLSGTITYTGNTDVGSCRSYGKWIMVKHGNGLSTLYAHLSLIGVNPGQTVTTGEIIGYSGNTGYSTGPHLHFGVYATEGLNVTKNSGSKYCGTVTVPYADLKAYLNPLSYL